MIRHSILALLLMLAVPAGTQNQSLSIPTSVPIHCSKQANNCSFLFGPHTMAILVAREAAGGTVTDSWGNAWTLDQCASAFDNGDCIFHANLTAPYSPPNSSYVNCCAGNHLAFSGNNFDDVWILLYDGIWKFDSGNYGTYADQNAPFKDCTNGGDCPYNWTMPIEADAGSLLVTWSNSNAQGQGIARPGAGWSVEASDGQFAVEDMLAPIDGVYIGSLVWRMADGSPSGGGHWLMGIAAYKRQ